MLLKWVAKDLSFLFGDSEDSDRTGRTAILLVLSCCGSNIASVSILENDQYYFSQGSLFDLVMNIPNFVATQNIKIFPSECFCSQGRKVCETRSPSKMNQRTIGPISLT